MCLVSKRVKQKALKTSQKQLRYEYMDCEEKCKFYSFTANHKALKEELKNRKFLMNVIGNSMNIMKNFLQLCQTTSLKH